MEELNDVAFDYMVIEENLNKETEFTKIKLRLPKLLAISLQKGDVVELTDGELLIVSHKKIIVCDKNGFQVCEIYLEGA